MSELDKFSVGLIMDIFIEHLNDDADYDEVQELTGEEALRFLGVN